MSEKVITGMQPEDIAALRQVVDPRVSPDGKWVAFGVSSVDKEQNRYSSRIWLAAADGSERARPFTAGPDDGSARWSPDGRTLALAVNQKDGTSKICLVPMGQGGERVTIATWSSGIGEIAWSPDGSQIAFVARDPDPEIYGKPGEERKPKDTPPRRVTRLFSRLDSEGWVSDRPSRVIVVDADGSTLPRVLTPRALSGRRAHMVARRDPHSLRLWSARNMGPRPDRGSVERACRRRRRAGTPDRARGLILPPFVVSRRIAYRVPSFPDATRRTPALPARGPGTFEW